MKICVDYVFEYFNNYLSITEADKKTVLHNEKLEKYRRQLREYEPEVREWVVGIYNEYGKQIHRYIGNIMKENELFFLYDTDSEFRNASYDCYSRLIKKFSFLYKQKSNLFNLNSLYRKMPKKSFVKGRKQELGILFMYYWFHDMEGDNDYWQEYLEAVLPALNKE